MLEGNYRGSLISRIKNLTCGAKGRMLNCPRSVDFTELLHHHVVLEMEELKSPQDKALIMALVMGRLAEAVKIEYRRDRSFRHITLVEEAHRLLTKVVPGDGESQKYSVGVFTDMLAEIRKYGESLIIVDQIPNKLSEDVLKNTATKIVHKLLARDDKEVIGDTMMLDEAQKTFLSNLRTGRLLYSLKTGARQYAPRSERSGTYTRLRSSRRGWRRMPLATRPATSWRTILSSGLAPLVMIWNITRR